MKIVVQLFAILLVATSLALADRPLEEYPPLALHPDNPHCFLFRGKPAILVGSGEHYGAVLNLDFDYIRYLDYSFTVSHPDGTRVGYRAPGGRSATLRKQLQALHDFINGFDVVHTKPDSSIIKTALPKGTTARALVGPGKQYAIYIRGGKQIDLKLELTAGEYDVRWIDPVSGKASAGAPIQSAGGVEMLVSPPFVNDVALSLKLGK